MLPPTMLGGFFLQLQRKQTGVQVPRPRRRGLVRGYPLAAVSAHPPLPVANSKAWRVTQAVESRSDSTCRR